jgi:hypothetical protein
MTREELGRVATGLGLGTSGVYRIFEPVSCHRPAKYFSQRTDNCTRIEVAKSVARADCEARRLNLRVREQPLFGVWLQDCRTVREALDRTGIAMAVGFKELDEDEERARLRKMSDEDLIREGKAARFLCSPKQNFGQAPRDVFVVALHLCIEEWRWRYPKV